MSLAIQCKEWTRGAWRDPVQFFQPRQRRECSCCGYQGLFVSASRNRQREYRCPNCASRPRDRQIALILQRHAIGLSGKRILHFAPEWWLFRRLRHQEGYVGGDVIRRRNANARVDITAIDFPDDHFDVLICNHVLEHVPEDSKAMAECARVLKPGGKAIFTVPIKNARPRTWEPPADMPIREVEAVCGRDHKRLYGLDMTERLGVAGFTTQTLWFTADETRRFRLVEEPVFLSAKP